MAGVESGLNSIYSHTNIALLLEYRSTKKIYATFFLFAILFIGIFASITFQVNVRVSYSLLSTSHRLNLTTRPCCGMSTPSIENSISSKSFTTREVSMNLLWSVQLGGWSQSSPILGDIDGDKKLEVVVGGENKTYAINAEDGTLLWTFDSGDARATNPVLADLNYDGILDVVITTREGKVFALTGQNANVLWQRTLDGGIITSPVLMPSIHGDRAPDVIVGSGKNVYIFWGSSGRNSGLFTLDGNTTSTPAVGDVNGDGHVEIVIADSNGYVYLLDPKTPRVIWNTRMGKDSFWDSPVLGDIDNDGVLEVIIGNSDHKVYALDGFFGRCDWTFTTGDRVIESPVIYDVNNDGLFEIIVGSTDNMVYALNGSNGSMLWEFHATTYFSPVIGDIDNDNNSELILNNYEELLVVDGSKPALEMRTRIFKSISTVSLGDINNDNKIELIVNNGTAVSAFDIPTAGVAYYWSYQGGDIWRNNNVFDIDPDMDALSSTTEKLIGTNATNPDTDEDGMPDGWEFVYGLDPKSHDDASLDLDGDGLTNLQEFQRKTNPTIKDNGQDNTNDSEEGSNGAGMTSGLIPYNSLGILFLVFIAVVTVVSVTLVVRKRYATTREKHIGRKEKKSTSMRETKTVQEATEKTDQAHKLYFRSLYEEFVKQEYSLSFLKAMPESQRVAFGKWVTERLISEGKHEIAKDILIEIGEYEKAIPIIVSLAVYYKSQGNLKKARELYKLTANLYRKLGDSQKAKEIEDTLK